MIIAYKKKGRAEKAICYKTSTIQTPINERMYNCFYCDNNYKKIKVGFCFCVPIRRNFSGGKSRKPVCAVYLHNTILYCDKSKKLGQL